ncbi:MAG: 1-deoxy-D-xylulose-5-phosphate reductoisomerase [Clostridiaceae bacterium]
MKKISILGSTGSIGTQTLDVIKNQNKDFNLIAISANKNYNKVIEIIREFSPSYIAITDEYAYNKIKNYCALNNETIEVFFGIKGLIKIATLDEVDLVVTSIVGMVGLIPTMEAIKKGKDIALANKETLVVGGDIVIKEAKKYNVNILPVDSEHGAIFQCLKNEDKLSIKNILLTASGGPFRGKNLEYLKSVTVEDALNHPKWNMGKKISIDSATLMNKGLEVIEAHHLFNVSYDNIEVLVHPESIVHSAIEYIDNSVIAQLAVTDMRLPIQYALNYPSRVPGIVSSLNLFEIGNLSFEKPDYETFKCLKLAFQSGKAGGLMPTILNAANEASVDLFLNRKIQFLDIGDIIEECLNVFENSYTIDIESILDIDNQVRNYITNKWC